MRCFTAHASSETDLVATYISGEPGEPCKVLHLTKATLSRFLATGGARPIGPARDRRGGGRARGLAA